MRNIKEQLTPNKLSVLLIQERKTFADIGRTYKTSRQRIHQIFNEYNNDEEYKQLFEEYKKMPTKKELEEKIDKHYTYSQLCKEYHVSFLKLKKILKEYQLEKKFINGELTKDVLEDLFLNKGFTDKQIADMYDCSDNTVKKLRQDKEIVKRRRK